jgi:hypothetical protein
MLEARLPILWFRVIVQVDATLVRAVNILTLTTVKAQPPYTKPLNNGDAAMLSESVVDLTEDSVVNIEQATGEVSGRGLCHQCGKACDLQKISIYALTSHQSTSFAQMGEQDDHTSGKLHAKVEFLIDIRYEQ